MHLAIQARGNTGIHIKAKTMREDEAANAIWKFVEANLPADNSGYKLKPLRKSLDLTLQNGLSWSYRFTAEVYLPDGQRRNDKHFEGGFNPGNGGINLQEITHRNFSDGYYQDSKQL